MKSVVDNDGARKADLARIHIAKKALGYTDEEYRDVMFAVARVRSSADLDFTGRKRLIEHFIRCGWSGSKPEPKHAASAAAPQLAPNRKPAQKPRRPTPSEAVAPMCRKVRAQLISLGRKPDTYADGIAQQMFKVQFYEWCTPEQLHAVIAALGAEQARHGITFKPRKP